MAQAAASWGFYVLLLLTILGAWRQVYEIKAQCPINNLAAYYKTYTKSNNCYPQPSDMYTHFQCTPASSTYSIWCRVQNPVRRKSTFPPLPLKPCHEGWAMGRNPSYTLIIQASILLCLISILSPPHSVFIFYLCILRESKISHYSFRSCFSSSRGYRMKQFWVLFLTVSQVTYLRVQLKNWDT